MLDKEVTRNNRSPLEIRAVPEESSNHNKGIIQIGDLKERIEKNNKMENTELNRFRRMLEDHKIDTNCENKKKRKKSNEETERIHQKKKS